jgi:hypothetical protein
MLCAGHHTTTLRSTTAAAGSAWRRRLQQTPARSASSCCLRARSWAVTVQTHTHRGTTTMVKKAHPLAARIKKMMKADEDVGKIAHATPIMIGACCSGAQVTRGVRPVCVGGGGHKGGTRHRAGPVLSLSVLGGSHGDTCVCVCVAVCVCVCVSPPRRRTPTLKAHVLPTPHHASLCHGTRHRGQQAVPWSSSCSACAPALRRWAPRGAPRRSPAATCECSLWRVLRHGGARRRSLRRLR